LMLESPSYFSDAEAMAALKTCMGENVEGCEQRHCGESIKASCVAHHRLPAARDEPHNQVGRVDAYFNVRS
jgi:hypothetical protein